MLEPCLDPSLLPFQGGAPAGGMGSSRWRDEDGPSQCSFLPRTSGSAPDCCLRGTEMGLFKLTTARIALGLWNTKRMENVSKPKFLQ